MAKDGTNRGGARPGAGRPRKALTEKIAEGKTAEVMIQPTDIESAETPPVRDFMKELQRDGTKLLADDVYTETYQWLKERSCENCQQTACGTVCHEHFPLDTLRANRYKIWVHFKAPHNGCGDRLSLCSDVTELYETGKPNLESDFSDSP